jgi:ABC-2 type transport system ATP-binding protein
VTAAIEARGLRKTFRGKVALDEIDLRIEEGRIVGLIGPNGAGKTTALNTIVGLTTYEGHLDVLGCDPWRERDTLMREVCFIADVAVLPRWIRTSQVIDYVAGVHAGFDRARVDRLLARTGIGGDSKVRELSKGMVTQLHLALAMAINARLLVLDEPTLGLDPVFRKQFYDALLNDYFDGNRTIIIATHQLEEVQHILTDLVFMDRGRVALASSVDEIETRFVEVSVHPDRIVVARAMNPIHERQVLGRSIFLFDGVAPERLTALGEARTPNIPDLYLAVMESRSSATDGVRR